MKQVEHRLIESGKGGNAQGACENGGVRVASPLHGTDTKNSIGSKLCRVRGSKVMCNKNDWSGKSIQIRCLCMLFAQMANGFTCHIAHISSTSRKQ